MTDKKPEIQDQSKRDFVTTTAFCTAGIGLACATIPFIDNMNPARDVAALASIEVDISNIKIGEEKKVMWRGKPVFIKRRTKKEIADAKNVKLTELKHPEEDSDRVQKDQWLVTIGICTHLGCIPIGGQGEYKGWFCPCHGSVYDTSGRIRKGPAPKNLEIPPYKFLDDKLIKIG